MSSSIPARVPLAAALVLAFALPVLADENHAPADAKPATSGTPKAVLEETTFNGGDIPKGETVEHDFIVKNAGNAELLITSVKPACGCTVSDFDKVVAPGKTGKIKLKVDTARFKGPISKSATVTTNDPEQPSIRLVMNANVQTYVDVLPRDSVFFRQYRGEAEEKKEELTLKSNEEGDFKVKEVQVTGEGIKYELTPGAAGSKEYKLAVWMDRQAPIGNVNGSLKVLTSSAKEPQVEIPVRGLILGQIQVNPSTLYFRIDTAAKEVVPTGASVNLRERGEKDAPVVAKVTKDDRLKVLESSAEWHKVQTSGGVQGWVAASVVQPAPPATGTADASSTQKVINVTHRQDTAFKLVGTGIEGPQLGEQALKVVTEPVKEGQSYRVTVSYTGSLPKGNYNGQLVLRTSDKSEAEVRVPLYIVVS